MNASVPNSDNRVPTLPPIAPVRYDQPLLPSIFSFDHGVAMVRRLKVAPVQQNSEILVQDGDIKSWVDYFPAGEIARLEQACATPEGQSVLLNDQPCRQFIEQAKAQMARVTGASTSGTH